MKLTRKLALVALALTAALIPLVTAKPYTCPSGSFFDGIDGGSCWKCPDNSKRTIHSVKSDWACETPAHYTHARATIRQRERYCATKIFGKCIYAKRCPGGFIRHALSNDCFNCNGLKRSIHSVYGDKACFRYHELQKHRAISMGRAQWVCGGKGKRACTVTERIPSCDRDLIEDFTLTNVKSGSLGVCIPKIDVPQFIAAAKRDSLNEAKEHGKLVGSVAECLFKNRKQFLNAAKDFRLIERVARGCFGSEFENKIKQLGYQTLTVGVSGSLGVGLQAESEIGVAIALRNSDVKGYSSLSYSFSPSVGAGLGVTVGLSKETIADMEGNDHGVSVGVGTKGIVPLLDVGAGIGIDYSYEGEVTRYSYSFFAGIGAGPPADMSYARGTTALFG